VFLVAVASGVGLGKGDLAVVVIIVVPSLEVVFGHAVTTIAGFIV
tara:strand:+ start:84 stop:218 length:135 start_codon:yes stop_codon:yes gene_type:complete